MGTDGFGDDHLPLNAEIEPIGNTFHGEVIATYVGEVAVPVDAKGVVRIPDMRDPRRRRRRPRGPRLKGLTGVCGMTGST
jgi:hypothetical protein